VRSELERCRQNLGLCDLPFSRVNQLLKGLYNRKVMGKRKPTLRRMIYAVFQLELHAWSVSVEQQHKKRVKRRAGVEGEYLEDLRGLHFQLVLERLTLIHYGKHRCLSYADQMDEYVLETNHVALQIVQTGVSMWLFKRRIGRTVGGHPWPSNPMWAAMPEAFKTAIEGVATTRMRSLGILLGEIERKSKPKLMDVELPKRERSLQDKTAAEEGGGQGAKGLARFIPCKKTKRAKDRGEVREIEFMDSPRLDSESGSPSSQGSPREETAADRKVRGRQAGDRMPAAPLALGPSTLRCCRHGSFSLSAACAEDTLRTLFYSRGVWLSLLCDRTMRRCCPS
jgi:hypothetical protein